MEEMRLLPAEMADLEAQRAAKRAARHALEAEVAVLETKLEAASLASAGHADALGPEDSAAQVRGIRAVGFSFRRAFPGIYHAISRAC